MEKSLYIIIFFLTITVVPGRVFHFSSIAYINLALLLFFFVGSFWTAYKQILFEGEVDSNKMIGSLSLYLLLGLVWTVLYLLLLQLDPTAFTGIDAGSWKQNFTQMAYYSFVTLTTLGYGDVLPQNHVAQFFVYMEAIMGVFYMAIIVSSLISLRLANLKKKD
ncbi:MAG: two pore domain potassium channel family protein [Epsilonproteobacteria bacterium]|nr:two pore domain potassium channel family protein [Campylobacterota bacterium]